MSIPEVPEGTSLWTLGAGALGSLLYLRRFLSRQNVDIRKDSAESNLIKTLQDERDKAMQAATEAWKSKAEDAKLIGELTGEIRSLRQAMTELKEELDSVNARLRELTGDAEHGQQS